MTPCYVVIMAGGSGTRFWPRSRRSLPKQLLEISPGETLIQATLARIPKDIPPTQILVITNAEQVAGMRKQIDLPAENIIAEPVGRDTGPCLALAAGIVEERSPGALMVAMAADHIIEPIESFMASIELAREIAAKRDAIVTLGIKPRHAACGYGYIEVGDNLDDHDAFEVLRFREKPNQEDANSFVAAGNFFWNSGIFIWRAGRILEAIRKYQPHVFADIAKIMAAPEGPARTACMAEVYPNIDKVSIDKGVIEHVDNIACVEAQFNWDDVGSLNAIARHNSADADGNVIMGEASVLEVANCIVDNRDDGLVALLGVENLIVVKTPDAILVASRDREEEVKALVEQIRREHGEDYL